jgi:ParB-like chromosome segregation protein Spo0J
VAFLAACFRDLGERQLVPILAQEDGRIVDGHCRWKALQAAGATHALVVAWSGKNPPTPEQVARINATQSHVEPAGDTLERWRRLLDDHGWTVERLADAIGRSASKVRDAVAAWRKVPAPIKEADKAKPAGARMSKAEIEKVAAESRKGAADVRGRVRNGRSSQEDRPVSPGGAKLAQPPSSPTPKPASFLAQVSTHQAYCIDDRFTVPVTVSREDWAILRTAKQWRIIPA